MKNDLTSAPLLAASFALSGYPVQITWTELFFKVPATSENYTRRSRSGGSHTVHMLPGTPTPRFAYRAWRQMQPTFGQEVLDDLAVAMAATGYWQIS